jgi:hypothetical protein
LREEKVTLRRVTRSARELTGCKTLRRRTVSSTTLISSSAKLAPRQRLIPPPNGIHP